MRPHGVCEHNLQSLRVVDMLEQRYAAFDGLNLTFEAREGILKHCSLKNARALGEIGERFVKRRRPSLEAQVAHLADEKASMLKYARLPPRRLRHETVRRMIDTLVTDLVRTSAENIRRHAPGTIEDVRRAPPLIAFSPRIRKESEDLKRFLREHLYRHYRVVRMSNKARRIVADLFTALLADSRLLAPAIQERARAGEARGIADYIAGMTDRYAILEHRRLFAIEET